MRPLAIAAIVAAMLGGCRSKDPGDAIGGDRLAPAQDAAPRKRPAELAHLTLKVVGMT